MASEQRTTPYYRAARFTGEQAAGSAYSQIQDLIFAEPDCELSVYRFHMTEIWHVAVVGDPPDMEIGQKLETVLADGTSVALGSTTLSFLQRRRIEERRPGIWVERHHRPGLGFRFRELTATTLFPLGRVMMTANLQRKLQDIDPERWEEDLKLLIGRHASGDWGDLDSHDHDENDKALRHGGRLLSAYTTSEGVKVWVITEADRSSTTALLPDDY